MAGQQASQVPLGEHVVSTEQTFMNQLQVDSLPDLPPLFMPVFVTGAGIDIDVINFLLESSLPAIARVLRTAIKMGEDLSTTAIPRLILPPTRDPQHLWFPPEPPLSADKTTFPFVGKSFSEIFAAWVGKDQATIHLDVAPFRNVKGVKNKPRFWSEQTFLVLDEQTMKVHYEPTALVVYLNSASSNEEDIDTARCVLPISLRLMALLDGPKYDLKYFKDRLADEDGVLRYRRFESWFKPGGGADQETKAQGLSLWFDNEE